MLRGRRGWGHARSITPVRRVSGKFGDAFYCALILLGCGDVGVSPDGTLLGPSFDFADSGMATNAAEDQFL
ncbi:MAG: hypothetical protein C0421_09275 [Hyphomonas sp.]|nr:hypothetical protein [Hyphomonas sp.]